MRKWAESEVDTFGVADIQYHEVFTQSGTALVAIPDAECDGEIRRTMYHDGTLLFTQELLAHTWQELVATGTTHIGTATLTTDYVI